MAPYFAEHARVDLTPAARRPHHTFVKELAPRRWEATQRIVDEAGEADWAIFCEIDGTDEVDRDRPLIRLVRIGT